MGVAGALVGAALTAWQTGVFDASGEQRLCWGSLSKSDVRGVFRSDLSISAEEIRPAFGDDGGAEPRGSCRIAFSNKLGIQTQLTVRLHQLDSDNNREDEAWAAQFLTPQMTPFGEGIVGLASETRTWLELPKDCADSWFVHGPTVVDVSWGRVPLLGEVNRGGRDRVARAAVILANGAMRALGCDGTLPIPRAGLATPPPFQDLRPERLCGIKGLMLTPPKAKARDLYNMMITRGTGPARVCGIGLQPGGAQLRLITIEEPRLAEVFSRLRRYGGPTEAGKDGESMVRPDLALYETPCRGSGGDSRVVFLVQDDRAGSDDLPRRLLPRYVAAEVKRLGCGPGDIALPS